jgi:hypothetical protein
MQARIFSEEQKPRKEIAWKVHAIMNKKKKRNKMIMQKLILKPAFAYVFKNTLLYSHQNKNKDLPREIGGLQAGSCSDRVSVLSKSIEKLDGLAASALSSGRRT